MANAGLASGDVAKLQAAAWKELDAAGRTRWVAQAAADVARFEQEKKDHDERCLAAQAVAHTAVMAEERSAAQPRAQPVRRQPARLLPKRAKAAVGSANAARQAADEACSDSEDEWDEFGDADGAQSDISLCDRDEE